MRGFFLVLEGPEGAGKSTLAATLTARARGDRVDRRGGAGTGRDHGG